MNLAQALQQYAHILSMNGIEDCHIEARMLLGYAANLSPVQIYTEPEQRLSWEEEGKLQEMVRRRLKHEPAAYILQHREFYGFDFYVDSRVLIPRPETEILVDASLESAANRSCITRPLLLADIGTGCGAIAISIALNLPGSKVYAIDLSSSALEVARLNCEYHRVADQITILSGDLLQPLPEPVDLIVANLPYIKNSELPSLSPEIAKFEPRMALDGGRSGLQCIRQLLQQQVKKKINRGGCLLLEIGQNQEKEISQLIYSCLNEVNFRFIADFNGINRVVKIDF